MGLGWVPVPVRSYPPPRARWHGEKGRSFRGQRGLGYVWRRRRRRGGWRVVGLHTPVADQLRRLTLREVALLVKAERIGLPPMQVRQDQAPRDMTLSRSTVITTILAPKLPQRAPRAGAGGNGLLHFTLRSRWCHVRITPGRYRPESDEECCSKGRAHSHANPCRERPWCAERPERSWCVPSLGCSPVWRGRGPASRSRPGIPTVKRRSPSQERASRTTSRTPPGCRSSSVPTRGDDGQPADEQFVL